MVLELYQLPMSAPCRQVMMVGKILNLSFDTKPLYLMKGEHLQPEFLKINPFHCIPTLVDDGFALWESRPIMTYLVNKYAPESSLYPKDVKARATVERWLYWDTGSLYATLFSYYFPIIQGIKRDPAIATLFMDKVRSGLASIGFVRKQNQNSRIFLIIAIIYETVTILIHHYSFELPKYGFSLKVLIVFTLASIAQCVFSCNSLLNAASTHNRV